MEKPGAGPRPLRRVDTLAAETSRTGQTRFHLAGFPGGGAGGGFAFWLAGALTIDLPRIVLRSDFPRFKTYAQCGQCISASVISFSIAIIEG